MAIDKLNLKDFAALSGYDLDFIKAHPAIFNLVKRTIASGDVTSPQAKANFQRDFEKTPWYKKNASWARDFFLAEAKGGADFNAKMETAQEAVRARAVQLGAQLSAEALKTFTTAYFVNGWGEPGREQMLDQALTGQLEDFDVDYLDYGKGGPEAIMSKLRATATANGVHFDESYYEGAVRAVMGGYGTLADYDAEIRDKAATMMPQYADRIKAGEDARALASPYINMYANMFDLNPEAVGLDDPTIKEAFGQVDEKGNPKAIGMWDFQKLLRKKPEWAYTKDANDRVSSLTGDIVRMFGFGG